MLCACAIDKNQAGARKMSLKIIEHCVALIWRNADLSGARLNDSKLINDRKSYFEKEVYF